MNKGVLCMSEGINKVVISKKWNNPEITLKVSRVEEDIRLEISLKDFIEAVKKELDFGLFFKQLKENIGSVTWIFSDPKFEARFKEAVNDLHFDERLDKAVVNVIEGIKESSVYIANEIPII
jgi:hypothetical protein